VYHFYDITTKLRDTAIRINGFERLQEFRSENGISINSIYNNTVIYDKEKMNGKYQVGSGCVVAVAHDTPFINNSILDDNGNINKIFQVSDTDYLEAARNGDEREQQRLVAQGAKERRGAAATVFFISEAASLRERHFHANRLACRTRSRNSTPCG